MISLILIVAVVAFFVSVFNSDKWTITKEQLLSNSGATIYDKDGNEIVKLTGDEINKKIDKSEMGIVPDAFISIEDERFYEHKGVDIKRTSHAILSYIVNRGNSNFGGSTITQQLVKITMKDDSRNGVAGIQRKIREWSRATKLEKILTKDEIIQTYLNKIFLGSTSNGLEIRGVAAAADYYFNKDCKDLSVAEAAYIAGINHSPSLYNAFSDDEAMKEKIKKRTTTVVNKMHELGKINDDEYNSAISEIDDGIKFNKGTISNGNADIDYHTAAAINQIASELSDKQDLKYEEAREQIVSSGYKIYTTVDTNVQSKMEEEYKKDSYIKSGNVSGGSATKDQRKGQSAMCIIDPKTGYIVGEVGGLGSSANPLGLNRGTSKRQPGSTFKPLATIAPGLENKVITPATLFYDHKTTFSGNYSPKNDSNIYHGVISIRDAIKYSSNIPEVKLISIMGVTKSTDFLKKIGIDVDPANTGLSLALGSAEVSPVQMAAGFAMIANDGEYIEPTFYTKVTDVNDNVIIEKEQTTERVMSKENAYLEKSILEGPISAGGTAANYAGYLGKMAVAGKTGTSDAGVDRWFCGFTPYYAAACWYGADNGRNYDGKGNNITFYNTGNLAASIWFPVMKSIHKDLEVKDFDRPDGIVEVKICKATGRKAASTCKNTYTEICSKDNIPKTCEGDSGSQDVKICKDSGKIATEYCPNTEVKTFGGVIDTEKKATWTPKLSGSSAPTEVCDIHKAPEKTNIPNVIGKTESEARKTLEEAGYKVTTLKGSSNDYDKGIVTKMTPTTANKGDTITIVINQQDNKKEDTTKKNTTKENTKNTTTSTESDKGKSANKNETKK